MKIKFVNEIYKQGFKEKESRIECIKLILLTDGDEGKYCGMKDYRQGHIKLTFDGRCKLDSPTMYANASGF